MPVADQTILTLDGVVKEFPVARGALFQRGLSTVKAVSGVSFVVRRGETFALVGESGCGKSTLARLITALERPSAGQVYFDGVDIHRLGRTDLRSARRDFQLMFQDPYSSLDPRMRVGATLTEPLDVQSVGNRSSRRERVAALLNEVGLSPSLVERHPHQFSGGQRQRIGLARALALNPKLIVADEPVSALDVSIRSQVLNLMKRLQAAHGLTYVLISHDLSVVRYLANRIGVMYLGKLVEIGTTEELYARPAHPYTEALLSAIPTPSTRPSARRRSEPLRGELPSAIEPPSGCRFRTRCPRAEEICAVIEPPEQSAGVGHKVACHFPLQLADRRGADSLPQDSSRLATASATPRAGGTSK